MQLFWLPKFICVAIDKLIHNFLWSSLGDKMGWNLVNWDQFNCPKLASRLGIPTFRLANTSFLGKLV